MTKIIACKYEDWDDTTNPRLCQCSKYEGVDCANVPDDVASCPDFEAEPTPPSDKREQILEILKRHRPHRTWSLPDAECADQILKLMEK